MSVGVADEVCEDGDLREPLEHLGAGTMSIQQLGNGSEARAPELFAFASTSAPIDRNTQRLTRVLLMKTCHGPVSIDSAVVAFDGEDPEGAHAHDLRRHGGEADRVVPESTHRTLNP